MLCRRRMPAAHVARSAICKLRSHPADGRVRSYPVFRSLIPSVASSSQSSQAGSPASRRNAAYYATSVVDFLTSSDDQIHAKLTQPQGFTLTPEQLAAWKFQLPNLRNALSDTDGWIHIEFNIPRLGRRVDAILVSGPAIVAIEFKVGAKGYERIDYEQAWDYGLDLKNFHAPSHAAPVFTVLCATEAETSDSRWKAPHGDGVYPPFRCNARSLPNAIRLALAQASGAPLDAKAWGEGNYSPTPTIIEAARSLYHRHTVHDITRNDAGAANLTATAGAVERVIADAKARRRKSIVFVTGVPGAGKTLVGLNIATRHGAKADDAHAVFLSGNGPLVAVLREALARDEHTRRRLTDARARIGTARSAVKAFLQNVHHFRDDTIRNPTAPHDHVVVFDEAQRAWNAQMLGNFMKRKRGMPGFTQTEPELLIGAMDRHEDWAVVVCLVGGGQEINTGEAGIRAWLDAVRGTYTGWNVHISPILSDSEFSAHDAIDGLRQSSQTASRASFDSSLHLATSMRSFRAESVSQFVKAVLDGETAVGNGLLRAFERQYPIVLTRSIRSARNWVRKQRRGSERAGLLASSSAQRLKPHAVDIRVNINPVHWFLGPAKDTRSSQYLEDAATEFQVQGLELDWTVVAWDADLRRQDGDWTYHNFRGAKWTTVNKAERRQYLKNAYRVLLTRARQGMVIFVPPGRRRDRTRSPAFYDGVFAYLQKMGLPEI